jgi:type I restriction enzyme M protein
VLFRGQPEVEEETGEFDDEGNPKIKRRKPDDEHLIRKALLDMRLIDAVISLPLNVFYGAGVPACLLILRKKRPLQPKSRKDSVLLIYAARHYRELSAQNELRPQDVMRMLVHYHGYGDAAEVPGLVKEHSGRIRKHIELREEDEVGRLMAEYQVHADRLAKFDAQLAAANIPGASPAARLEKQREKIAAKIAERDEKIAEARRRAANDRRDVDAVGAELVTMYADPDELLKHARVVDLNEIEENEFNLNIPRFVDTFDPEPHIDVKDALRALGDAESAAKRAEMQLEKLLKTIGYVAD